MIADNEYSAQEMDRRALEREEKEKREIELYGKDAADWLARWDAGKTVWSISMGSLGTGYEHGIQLLAAELLRYFLKTGVNWWDGMEDQNLRKWKEVRKGMDEVIAIVDKRVEFTGSMVNAAINLASHLYINGPRHVMSNEKVKNRHIQVSKTHVTPTTG